MDRIGHVGGNVNLVLRLRVLLDPYRGPATAARQFGADRVIAERRVLRQFQLQVKTAVLVRGEGTVQDLVVIRVLNRDRHLFARQRAHAPAQADGSLQEDGVARAVNWSISNQVKLGNVG